MIATKPYIIYQLPKSRTTQALKGGKIQKAWGNINLFLSYCTNCDIEKPNSIKLIGYSADEENGEFSDWANKMLEDTEKYFGKGNTSPVSYSYPQNIPSIQTYTEWLLTSDDLANAVGFMMAGEPWPKYNLGPIELILSYDFKLLEPVTKYELPNQQFNSSFLIWLSKSNSISPRLCFPFDSPNDSFWKYLKEIEPFLPFKFDNKYLRLVRSNKNGTSNIFSKL